MLNFSYISYSEGREFVEPLEGKYQYCAFLYGPEVKVVILLQEYKA